MDILSYLIGFVVIFGAVVLIHELGHFLVAKFNGIQVDAFAIGIGPKIIGIEYGETEYRIAAFPIGGYVSLAGEEPGQADDNPRAFYNQNTIVRISVLAAGGIFNLFLGYLLYSALAMGPGTVTMPAKIGYVAPDKPAHGKLQIGDELLSINGKEVDNYREFGIESRLLGSDTHTIAFLRNGKKDVVNIKPQKVEQKKIGDSRYVIGIGAYIPPKINQVKAGSAAADKGIESGGVIRKFNNKPVQSWTQFGRYLQEEKDKFTILVQYEDKAKETYSFTPPKNVDGQDELQKWKGGLGIAPSINRKKFGVIGGLKEGYRNLLRDIMLLYEGVMGMINQNLSVKSMAGPVGIISLTGRVASAGMWAMVKFTAFLTINLGIINLLPIPVLDGGHILLTLPEFITGKPLPEKVTKTANHIGLFLLLFFFVAVTIIDLSRFDWLMNLF